MVGFNPLLTAFLLDIYEASLRSKLPNVAFGLNCGDGAITSFLTEKDGHHRPVPRFFSAEHNASSHPCT